MREGSTKTKIPIGLALIIAGLLLGACQQIPQPRDGSRLRVALTEAESPEEIEKMVRASLEQQYPHADIAHDYTLYPVTNGLARFLFAQVANAPRGLDMFNLYCYEQEKPGVWLLRAYVPVNAYYYTNNLDRELKFQINNDYVNVLFREKVVFSGISKK